MKRFILYTLLVAVLGVYSHVQAQTKNYDFGWGLSGGGAHGDNRTGDKWMMQFRGFLQYEILTSMLTTQLGLGYTELSAPDIYRSENFITDLRLLFSPFSLPNLNPYLFAGFGLSKDLKRTGSDFLPMVPFGAGIQTRIASGILLDINGGYSLYVSDELDGHARSGTDLNALTNGKHDGYYGFSIGLAFTIGDGKDKAEELRKKQIAEAEALRLKQQAEADARNVKALTDAEARRVKQQADADAEAARVKAANIAEAQRIKDSTNAAALRLAAQKKTADTVIVLVKGETVVLRGVNFEFNKATLTRYSENILWKAYNAMIANPDVQVVITGHTDNVGSQEYNQALSLKRAQAVKNWLVRNGIESSRMRTVGKGENEPMASNETAEGRLENRRIEFYVEK
ncbi:MAG: OmpA family protein [Bacteroidetes bacterium]|nr:OmpA family protein [Bacteroidota bacterium]